MAKLITLEGYNEFNCIGSDCPETCCQQWDITLDEHTLETYRNYPGEFGEKLRNSIKQVGDRYILKFKEDGFCPFLNSDLLCDVYSTIGPQHMCTICTEYPRVRYAFGDYGFYFLSISCPEYARMLLTTNKKMSLSTKDVEINMNIPATLDWDKYNIIIKAFEISFSLIQNRNYSLIDRIKLFIVFNNLLDASVANNKYAEANETIEFFSYEDNFPLALNSVQNLNCGNVVTLLTFIKSLTKDSRLFRDDSYLASTLQDFSNKIHNNTISIDEIDSILNAVIDSDYEVRFEKILCHSIFAYYPIAAYNQGIYAAMLKALTLFNIQRIVAAIYMNHYSSLKLDEHIKIINTISRVIEHSNGTDYIIKDLEESNLTSLNKLFELL